MYNNKEVVVFNPFDSTTIEGIQLLSDQLNELKSNNYEYILVPFFSETPLIQIIATKGETKNVQS